MAALELVGDQLFLESIHVATLTPRVSGTLLTYVEDHLELDPDEIEDDEAAAVARAEEAAAEYLDSVTERMEERHKDQLIDLEARIQDLCTVIKEQADMPTPDWRTELLRAVAEIESLF